MFVIDSYKKFLLKKKINGLVLTISWWNRINNVKDIYSVESDPSLWAIAFKMSSLNEFLLFSQAFRQTLIRTVSGAIRCCLFEMMSGPDENSRSTGTPVPDAARKSFAILARFGNSFWWICKMTKRINLKHLINQSSNELLIRTFHHPNTPSIPVFSLTNISGSTTLSLKYVLRSSSLDVFW